MLQRELLIDAFGRIGEEARRGCEGLTAEALVYRPDADGNSIAWLVWHLTRVQDDHVSEIADHPQAWVDGGWSERFGMAPDVHETGYGHSSDQVATVRPDGPELLLAYHEAVGDRCLAYLETVEPEDLDRIIDTNWDPPVTVGVRLVSVVSDCLQHAGQANYLRGIIERRA